MIELTWQFPGKLILMEDIRAFEKRHGVELPEDYQQFLLSTNGGMPSPPVIHSRTGYKVGLCQLYSLNDDYPYDLDRKCSSTDWEEGYSLGYLRIGRDSGGSAIFISTRGDDRGSIHFLDREELIRPSNKPIKLADSFDQFLSELEEY